MHHPATIQQLRQLLAERFPGAPARAGLFFSTGVIPLDHALGGGLCKGTLTEISTPPDTAGCLTILNAILCASAQEGRPIALIDGSDGFDPQPLEPALLAHLLWVRCRNTAQFFKAADLLLRDGNLPIVLLDLRGSARS
jgi:RecA/RadA recombinase